MDAAPNLVHNHVVNRLIGLILILALALVAPARAGAAAAAGSFADPDSGFLEQYAATYRFNLGLPSNIKVTPHGDQVLFLRSGPRSFVNDLWCFEVATRRERVLLTAARVLHGGGERLTAEESARRERQRVATRGIVSYDLSEDGRRVLVPLAGRLFVIERGSGAIKELNGGRGFPIDPQFSPDGSQVACVRNGDLRVFDVDSGRERTITSGASATITHGLAEFVAQEEMDRFSGYWWSPDSRRIAYQETDTAPVEVLHIMDPAHPEREPQAWRYPRPGRSNAEVRLGIIPATGGKTTWVKWDRQSYPYLAVARWTKNAPLTLVVQNRRQTEEALLAVDEVSGATRTLWVERDVAWLNLDPKMPHWLDDGSAFLWTTERRGSWQLELHGKSGRLLRTLTPRTFNLRGFVDADQGAGCAWVTGGDDPTQIQIFRVPLDPHRASIEQVTHDPGMNGTVFATQHQVAVRSLSRSDGSPTQTVVDAHGKTIATLRSLAEIPLVTPRVQFVAVGPRKYRAAILRPRSFRPGVRYPVIVNVYGGPHGQMVTRSRNPFLLPQWLADHGFVVVMLDGRGTPGRGRAWERAIKGNLIEVPLEDQVEGLRALGAVYPELDLSRVGIYGWSFGGYFSAMAIMRRPDVFRASVAGAPVVDWRDYDTHYTERYMGLPDDNPGGYQAASVLTYADRLERPLLLVHGTADDNVYFLHSMKLCEALFRAGKPFEFLPLAGFTHMVPDPVVTRRLYQRIEAFLARNVAGPRTEPGADPPSR